MNKQRNQNSNPSLFIKFISINNLKILPDSDLENLIFLTMERMNCYISCDKNLFNLILVILKKCHEKLKKKLKQQLFNKILNSFFLYFQELQNPLMSKDKELMKNFISHFKLFIEFGNKKYFKSASKELLESVILVSLACYFIESSLQNQVLGEVF